MARLWRWWQLLLPLLLLLLQRHRLLLLLLRPLSYRIRQWPHLLAVSRAHVLPPQPALPG